MLDTDALGSFLEGTVAEFAARLLTLEAHSPLTNTSQLRHNSSQPTITV